MDQFTWPFQFLVCFLLYQVSASSSSPLSSFASPAHPLCRHEQRSALLQIKQMFTIDSVVSSGCEFSYPKTSSWSEGNATDCCSWDGVTCDVFTGDVIGLDLSCSQLYGRIFPNSSLFHLSHLRRLNLAHNDFDDSPISHAFGNFASLTHLNLSYSSFSGSIPTEISHLSKLVSLDLSSSMWATQSLELLHFEIFLRNLTQLQELILPGLNLSSVLPDSLLNLSSLTALDLSSTGLRGNLPDGVFNLPNLQRLNLRENNDLVINFPRSTWRSGNRKSLESLDLSRTSLSGELPNSIGDLYSLNYLDLSKTSLSGELPNSIGDLHSLNYLDLSKTSLSGELPNSICDLYSLKYLDLSQTSLSGELPNSIGDLYSLNYLDISETSLSGELPNSIGNLYSLNHLDLHFCNFSGEISSTLSNLTMLESLYLSYNSLTGFIPPSMFALPSLTRLDLSSNCLTGPIPEFDLHLPLEFIDLSYNKLHGPIPQSISALVNLTILDLSSNDLSNVVYLQVPKNPLSSTNLTAVSRGNDKITLPSIEYLSMSSCNIEVFPDFVRTSKNLQHLDLSHNRIRGEIPWDVFREKHYLSFVNVSHNFLTSTKHLPPNLEYLDLSSNLLQGPLPIPSVPPSYFFISHNSLTGVIPSLICNTSSLFVLDLSHNKMSGAVPQCLGNSSSFLEGLQLRSNGFMGNLPLAYASGLRSLDFSGNQFEGPLPRSLANCTSLEILNVANNMITDTFPYWLESLPQLKVLVLRSNRFHGPVNISKSVHSFLMLRIIDISSNQFNGHLPARYFEYFQAMKNSTMPSEKYMSHVVVTQSYYDEVTVTMKGIVIEMPRILTIFTTIDFSANNFSGEIPNVIGNLLALKVLNFSHNRLTGHIPLSLGDLENLESLDISSNQLTGRIPSQLTELIFLSALNLSWNHLHGPIPQGRQFNTFENVSYVGNSGLCGFPLTKGCGAGNGTKVQPVLLRKEEDDSEFNVFFWKVVAIGYGCGMAVGLFLGSLMFLIGRPQFFVRLVERRRPQKVVRLRKMVTDTVGRRK